MYCKHRKFLTQKLHTPNFNIFNSFASLKATRIEAMSLQNDGMGGLVVSYKQQQKIDRDVEEFKQSLRRKKRKRKTSIKQQESKPMINDNTNSTQQLGESRDFTYTHLLDRIYGELYPKQKNNNKNEDIKEHLSLPRPKVGRFGSKKSAWVNIMETCHALKRDPLHLKKYFETELIANTNFNGSNYLIISGRFTPEVIQGILRRYIKQYVQCENCSSINTKMIKNNRTRVYELKCNKCLSTRSCQRIEKAFKTIANKGQRIKLKQQQQKEQEKK